MKNRTIVGLLLVCCAWVAGAHAQPAAAACDRECLRGHVTQLLYALVEHDVSGLPVADNLRVTEDAVETPLAKVGLVGTVTGPISSPPATRRSKRPSTIRQGSMPPRRLPP